MERFQKIIWNKRYKEEYEKLQNLEQGRQFCGHDMNHFLAVARLCYIFSLERNENLSKDIIYGTAFLHDLGRTVQYEKGISHEEAGAELAEIILKECDYEPEEIKVITEVIRNHRTGASEDHSFAEMFYLADKLSRDCIHCKARKDCYWPDDKKNDTYIC
ncbi:MULTISPECIES: HD domain-containing protein [Anaerostipes]|uniref:HD domain-containing protein n=1 Tax=Anaerostipes TaxID=207244 RepID=UPI00095160CC|nr:MULTISPECIES: HD domain-containing protein [unclassified Anaerostipes]MCI5624109.1 HD domain-containing protein [Anaerostipes sp.]MDY2725886.1 HD domain-containing protein [Anaerostipes faecalis]OLR60094.1 hypothetical protein BHF70_11040 [Anaerostipes sp. 494a]